MKENSYNLKNFFLNSGYIVNSQPSILLKIPEIPTHQCFCCEAKSADCVYGQLRNSQSCYDTRERFNKY